MNKKDLLGALEACHKQETRAAASRVMFFGVLATGTFFFWFFVARCVLQKLDPTPYEQNQNHQLPNPAGNPPASPARP